ncbi:cytochrome ubiquinol oxidase subunit I [Phycicoccus endophyticus]|uniref:Cytochrome ubiquinol oxidase subunit I n=1 Tax=Phycicoccus endophyticus TaxID=1690220 RepID=A0A7G9R1D3_9MICO|nr:cytochrome ubiquinol oxidase subunit I [Phycicoccus endophyticus]NHI18810.1 cytochrome ubiquinol oxidase subunit I [Phycicoccus endophyticus]QNN49408.1 cytochrome ubiquinol oxidase subunit I [Phycicoccus endophyticus]GGL36384.1 cytochrome ubiquinol oxidase subunit I [Phycicoccus endophyticus]
MGSSLDVARWQFAITTVYHFLFVPVTIGMSGVVAYFHTQWVRTHRPEYYRLTKFFGKLFLINFALGLVTGIVQEFQFGMNWSDYSRFVGDIFGAPLAFEALLAFFLESTFLGVWVFGWGRVPEKLHASTMWLTHIGTVLSAYFILAANSFMQHPVGYTFNPDTGRAEMSDFVAVLTNKVQLVTFPHVVLSAYMVGGAVIMGVGLWLLRRDRGTDDEPVYRKAVRVGAVVALVASVGVVVSGDVQGKIMTEVQPMKMAAAEALYDTESNAPFSVLSIGALDGSSATRIIEVPGLLSFLGTGSFDGTVEGINDLKVTEREMAQKVADQYGPDVAVLVADDDYTPIIPVAYWTFRLMMGFGFLTMIFAAMALWTTRKGGVPQSRWWTWVAVLTPLLPIIANSFGWIFTEMGRQPWLVYGLMTTATGVSPSVSVGEVWVSMVVYTLVYAALAVVEVKLFLTYVKRGADPYEDPSEHADADEDAPLQFAY